jgi:hypothetical protein
MYGMLLDGPLAGQHVVIDGKPPETIAAHGFPNDAELKEIAPGTEFPHADADYVTFRHRLTGIDGTPDPVAQYKHLPETVSDDEPTLLAQG